MAQLNNTTAQVTERIVQRSRAARTAYMARTRQAMDDGVARSHLTCGNLAHAFAAEGEADKNALAHGSGGNIGIISAYNDMLSAHQPFAVYPDIIRDEARKFGGTAQMASGVPAMCDGVTQGQPGMELSLFSRDVIALSAAVGLSHNCFDAAMYLGVCDKIIPGLVMAAASFGHIPAVFAPAGPMPSGLPNDEKSRVRQQYAKGEIGRDELLAAEMASYHSPGTCTFYGTANSNQMLMEFMGLHLPGSSFVNPGTPQREALTRYAARRALEITAGGENYTPVAEVLDERAFVNGIVGLHATGGSTNLTIHLIAMARAAGVIITWQDMAELAEVVPLMARVYPNGLADVNHFHAAGGLGFVIGELLGAGLLHDDVATVVGRGLHRYTQEPVLQGDELVWRAGTETSLNDKILRPYTDPFQSTGGLVMLSGNIGKAVIKVSAVAEEHRVVEAPARVFYDQESVKQAFRDKELQRDFICVLPYQGARANGMPELHSLTPVLTSLQAQGFKVALVTDGRMSGASGKVPAAIHLTDEACMGGVIGLVQDGDVIRLDANAGTLELKVSPDELSQRKPKQVDISHYHHGIGRELFGGFRQNVTSAAQGASAILPADLEQ